MGKGGKAILGVVGAFLGFSNPAMFGLSSTAHFAGALYGLSLGTTIWSATHKPSQIENYTRFDQFMNTINSNARIPVIYGTRKWAGAESYHSTSSDGKTLTKDTIIGEGEIDSIYGLCANNMLVSGDGNVIFGIENTLYSDATVQVINNNGNPTSNDKTLRLYANGKTTDILLQHPTDIHSNQDNDYSCDITKLIAYINGYNYVNTLAAEGWRTVNTVTTNDPPENIATLGTTKCYNSVVNLTLSKCLDKCSYEFHNGTPGQYPSNYIETGGYPNMAWVRTTLGYSDRLSGSNPTITYIVKGMKVYDTRTGVTAYSENPAMCIRDYLLSKRYGAGHIITEDMLDEDSFQEVADYCDEIITYKDQNGIVRQEPRYTLNIILDEKKKHIDHLSDMFAVCGCFLVFTNNHISLRIEKATPVSYAFNMDNIVKDSISFTETPIDDCPNRYSITYYEENQNWTGVRCLSEDTIDQQPWPTGRGKIINKDVTLVGCTSQSQALRTGRLYRDLNRLCPTVIQFQSSVMAMHLEPGDIVTVDYRNIFTGMPFRILEISESKGVFLIKAKQYNESIYNDNLGSEVQVKNYVKVPNPFDDIVPDVSNLTVKEVYYKQRSGEIIEYLDVSCDVPNYSFLNNCTVEFSENNEDYIFAGYMQSDGKVIINGIKVGKVYWVRVKVNNTLGRQSNGTVSDPCITIGKNVPPGNVQGLTCTETTGGFLLTWTPNDDVDIDGYIVYQGLNDCGVDDAIKIADKLYSNTLFVPITEGGNYVFYVFAIDTSGNISEIPATINGTFTLPATVRNFSVVKNGDNLDFKWADVGGSGMRYEIRRGPSWAVGERLVITFNTAHSLFFPVPGDHTFWIKAIDSYGNYSSEPSFVSTSVAQPQNRNIITTIDQVALGWPGNRLNAHISDSKLVLDSGATRGEYIVEVNLPQKISGRNWILSQAGSMTGDEISWGSANFSWDDLKSNTHWLEDENIVDAVVKHQISRQTDIPDNIIESFDLNTTLVGEKNNTQPVESVGVTYQSGRYKQGVFIGDNTKVSWNVNIPQVFSTVFYIKIIMPITYNTVYVVASGNNTWLRIGYDMDKGVFYLEDHLLRRNEVSLSYSSNLDYLTFGISQTATQRKFYVKSFSTGVVGSNIQPYTPIGNFTNVRLYP